MHRGGARFDRDRAAGRGRSFSASPSFHGGDRQYGAYGASNGRAAAAQEADPVADRQRDRKERRRRERREKKQTRIAQQEQWAQDRQLAKEAARERRAEEKLERQRKRQRAEREAAKAEKKSGKGKRHKAEAAPPHTKLKGTNSPASSVSTPRSRAATPVAALTTSTMIDSTTVPAEVTEKVRRLVNKLTTANVVDLTKDLSESMLSAGVPRASVMKGLAEQMERLCRLEAGPLSTTGTLPFAGLLRGMQLLHGNQVGAELVERLSAALHAQLAAAEEAAAGNTLMILAQLYLLYGVDVVFVMSLLRMLLRQGTHVVAQSASPSSSAASSPSPTAAAASPGLAGQAVCAAACGLALMRACGEKLLKESPAELEALLQEARRAAAQMRSATGSARFAALVELMGDIAAGRTRKARRTTTEEAAPVEAMLEDLCLLLPGQEKATATQRRTMKRLVLTTNVMSGLTWSQVTAPVKPPRWYVPGVMTGLGADGDDDSDAAHEGDTDSGDDESRRRLTSAERGEDGEEEETEEEGIAVLDEAELKRERIARMRTEEKALSGQRLNTEHKREIFKCIASATDDLECFTMLMYRDPGYTRFHDSCAVLLQCACQERRYNAYYVQVLMRFCSAKPACTKTLQFALWDRFKSIRIEATDVVGYFNLACCIADLMQNGIYTLSLLRGLDLENTTKTIGLFTRILLLRLIFQLPASRLTQLFFGGDGRSAHDLQVDTTALRRLLTKFMSLYFIDENASKRWLPSFYEVVAAGTSFDVSASAATANGGAGANAEDELLLRRNGSRPTSTLTAGAAAPSRSATPSRASSADAMLAQFMRRVQVVYKALRQGIS